MPYGSGFRSGIVRWGRVSLVGRNRASVGDSSVRCLGWLNHNNCDRLFVGRYAADLAGYDGTAR